MKKLILAALIAMTSGAAIAENEQIVFSTPNLAMPFEVHMQRTAVKAAKEMGVKLQVLDGQGSSPKQVADLENAITRGAQGFIVSPNDVNAVSSAVDEIQDTKLPVVTLDRSVDSQKSAALWRQQLQGRPGDWRLRQNQIPQRRGDHSVDRSTGFLLQH